MKLSAKIEKLLNEQISLEFSASSNYLAMASWCEITGYSGAATFFYAQSTEERDHMLKIIHYVNSLGGKSIIPSNKSPNSNFKNLENLLKTSLKNEQTVTKSIHKIVDVAIKEKDYSTNAFLEWFVNEQIQEETKFETLLQKFDLIGRDKLAINEIDKILQKESQSPE